MKQESGRNARNKTKQNERRKKAKERLEVQLKALAKISEGKEVPLLESDITRIRKEIETLNFRIVNV